MVFAFTITRGKIVEIEMQADPECLSGLDLAIPDGCGGRYIGGLCKIARVPPTPGSRLSDKLGDAISRLNSRLRRDILEAGVSLARARTLATLDREGSRRLTDLALAEQVAQPTMSALIGRLETDGLVSRSGEEADGRTVVVSITAAGRRCLGRLIERRSESLERALGDLEADDREAIGAALPALARLLKKMEERNAVPALR